jgi:hypothetical protein
MKEAYAWARSNHLMSCNTATTQILTKPLLGNTLEIEVAHHCWQADQYAIPQLSL